MVGCGIKASSNRLPIGNETLTNRPPIMIPVRRYPMIDWHPLSGIEMIILMERGSKCEHTLMLYYSYVEVKHLQGVGH